MCRLALGTVQFGLDYGVANQSGQVSFLEVKSILGKAVEAKIKLLDTAISYGRSEEVLGKIGVEQFDIVSKLPALPENTADIDSWVEKQVEGSLMRLGVQSLHGLLLHRPEDLLGQSGKNLVDALRRVQSYGLIKKLGVSIYDPLELDNIMHVMPIDLVQAPLSVIDRRLETSGWLSRLSQEGVEVHTRSAFLQGLLLMSRSRIPERFEAWRSLWDEWATEIRKKNISASAACLSYPLSLPEVSHVVVGVESTDQLKELIEASQNKYPKHDFSFMVSKDRKLINPSSW